MRQLVTSGNRCSEMRRRLAGFTLLELLVAVSLMAVLAIMCWRGLDSVIRARDTITASSDELRALTVTFTQMEDDLRRSWAARMYRLPQPVVDFSSPGANEPVALELLRETGSDDDASRVQRVIYRLRNGQLERGFSQWVLPASQTDSAQSGVGSLSGNNQAVMTWQPLITNVSSISMRAWMEPVAGGQTVAAWYDARALLPPPGGVNSPTRAITGLEFAMARTNRGRIVRLFSIRD